ncbi:hypothetical protein [Tissierella pigra]|uniref:hypothetical protein n=1 Tax=Tissierella pigra TaxID=2607614 RepID=UPI0018A6D28E|nr:hypothetical protein [Tissierella pigra]
MYIINIDFIREIIQSINATIANEPYITFPPKPVASRYLTDDVKFRCSKTIVARFNKKNIKNERLLFKIFVSSLINIYKKIIAEIMARIISTV